MVVRDQAQVSSSFDPYKHGEWGRLVNFHNVQNDVGWDTGNGVSALALD